MPDVPRQTAGWASRSARFPRLPKLRRPFREAGTGKYANAEILLVEMPTPEPAEVKESGMTNGIVATDPLGERCACSANQETCTTSPRQLVLAFLDAALDYCERALDDAVTVPARATVSLHVGRIALAVARRVRISGDVEVRP